MLIIIVFLVFEPNGEDGSLRIHRNFSQTHRKNSRGKQYLHFVDPSEAGRTHDGQNIELDRMPANWVSYRIIPNPQSPNALGQVRRYVSKLEDSDYFMHGDVSLGSLKLFHGWNLEAPDIIPDHSRARGIPLRCKLLVLAPPA